MKILVTGGTGFIGHALAMQLLDGGHDVHVIGRSASPSKEKCFQGIAYHQGNLAEGSIPKEPLSGTELVFHVAAKAGVGVSYGDYYSANYLGTTNLIEACHAHGVPRLIHTSTPSVVFSGESIRGGDESMPYLSSRLSPYAHSKALAEKAVLEAHSPGRFQTMALRPHLVWGEGDRHLLPRVIQRHRAKKLKIVGSGENQVDLTHIDNVCHAHACGMNALLESDEAGGKAYFIGQEEPVRLWPWLNQLFGKLGLPPLERRIPFPVTYFAGLFLEKAWGLAKPGADPPMTRFVACQLAHDHWFSSRAAKNEIGYRPLRSMDDCLEKSLPWLRSL